VFRDPAITSPETRVQSAYRSGQKWHPRPQTKNQTETRLSFNIEMLVKKHTGVKNILDMRRPPQNLLRRILK